MRTMTTVMLETAARHDSIRMRWERDLLNVAEAFAMDESERTRFAAKPIARLIAALPYLAGCDRPERTAIEHLGVYVLSVRSTRNAFFASPEDDHDVLARLEPIMRFRGGDRSIIDRGMALIALIMVVDYSRDMGIDRVLGKHNPIASGAWDAEEMTTELRMRIAAIDCPQMEAIMGSSEGDEGTEDWWSWE